MATLNIEIKKGKHRPYPVSFLICSGRTKKRISTGLTLSDGDLSANGKKIKNPVKAQLLEMKRRELQDKLDRINLEAMGSLPDAAYIVERLLASPAHLDFFDFATDWIEETNIKGKKNYVSTLHALEKYLGHRSLPFDAITYRFLSGFENFLSGKPRAQSLYLGLIRHLYREAMRRYNTDYDTIITNDPFLRYRVPRQIIRKGVRALTLEQLLSIADYRGKEGSKEQIARDCFMLSFCLMGMNSVDIYNARTFRNDTICYNRTKTRDRRTDEAYIEVKVQPVLSRLMKKYAGRSRVFNFWRRYPSPYAFNLNLNKGLKKVGQAVGIEHLNFYRARHTFATLSRNLMRFSKSDVDEALNHVGSLDLADIYIAKDFSIINDNNARLLERIFPGRVL